MFSSEKIHPAVSLTFCCGGQEAGCGEHRSYFVLNNNCSRADKVIAGLVVSVGSQGQVGSRQGLKNSQGLPCLSQVPSCWLERERPCLCYPYLPRRVQPQFYLGTVQGHVALSLGDTQFVLQKAGFTGGLNPACTCRASY